VTSPDRPIGAGLARAGLWPERLPRQEAVPVAAGPAATGATAAATAAPVLPVEQSAQRWPWRGVQWTLVYVGFLGYIFAITTYRFPIGDVSIVIALFGLLMQREPIRVPGVLKGLAVFLLWAVVGYTMTSYPGMVTAKLQIVGKLWLIALVAANALRTREQIRFFLFFWLGCFALYPVRGALFNYYIYHETLFGRALWNYIFSNPNDLAAYCILQLSMGLGLHALERKGPVRLATRLGMAVVPFLIVITKSRGAFLGFAGFLLLVLSGQKRRGRAIGLTILIAGIVLAVAPRGVLDRVFALQKIEQTGDVGAADEEGSAEQRYEIWKVARAVIAENPISGVGLGAYPAAHFRMFMRGQFKQTAYGYRDTHSTYLNVMAETGAIGFLIFVLSYGLTLMDIERTRRRAKALRPYTAQTLFALEAGTLGFFIAAIFGSMAYVSFLVLHVVVTWCVAELVRAELARAARQQRAAGTMQLVRGPTPLPGAR
jgi:O-antigen ligase